MTAASASVSAQVGTVYSPRRLRAISSRIFEVLRRWASTGSNDPRRPRPGLRPDAGPGSPGPGESR